MECKKWKKLNKFSSEIFGKISATYPQNYETQNYLKKLNVKNIKLIGNLKFAKNKQDQKVLLDKSSIKQLKGKKIWCASSTHPSEELLCAKAHIKGRLALQTLTVHTG